MNPGNDPKAAVPKFCLALEESRRTPDGRVRTAEELVAHFFPYNDASSTDRLFRFLPRDIRGPILTAWRVRGQKSALRDSDDKVRTVVHDALVAGDVDARMFEESVPATVLVRWVELPDWWTFWRGGKLGKYSILKALETAFELGLFDAEWFLATVASKDGKLRGTDVLADGLSKADLTEWLRALYTSADGSPRGIVAALGWDQIVSKTPDDVLVAVLDAMANKVGLTAKAGDVATVPVIPAAPLTPKPILGAPAGPGAASPAKLSPPSPAAERQQPPIDLATVAPSAPLPSDAPPDSEGWAHPSLNLPGVQAGPPSRAVEAPNSAKAQPRKLPAILFPSSARMTDPPVPEPAPSPPKEATVDMSVAKDDEIPISADAFDELGQPPTTVRPAPSEPPAATKGKRPSKAPRG